MLDMDMSGRKRVLPCTLVDVWSSLQSAAYWTESTLEQRKEKACVLRLGGMHAGHLRVSESADLANRPFGAKRQAGAWLTKVPGDNSQPVKKDTMRACFQLTCLC